MICTLTIVRYPKYFGWVGVLSMAVFHVPLFINKKISFYKLLGCGKNGTFDKTPDWLQWATLTVDSAALTDDSCWATAVNSHPTNVNFLKKWFKFFNAEVLTIILQPIEGHGTWDGQQPFGKLPKQTEYNGLIAVLTRATIRLNKLKNFWANVDAVASQMAGAKGFITSFGIGEVPLIKQATFSIWDSKTDMKNFAYNLHQHQDVIRKTHKEDWYSEDMFTRFIPIACYGTINGKNPLAEKL
ncbi:MAG: spheroidene monooxygenase [Deinococcales bacterium]|nr:spheroidene monooxygenase [Chitinophagaceae bacterium]